MFFIYTCNLLFCPFLKNRNLAWNKIAIIHPNAFSTLPSLIKLWVFHYLFVACLLIIGDHLDNKKKSWFCWRHNADCLSSVFSTLSCGHNQGGAPLLLQGHMGLKWIIEIWVTAGSDYSGEVHFCWLIRWNGKICQFSSEGLPFLLFAIWLMENLPVHPPLIFFSSSFHLLILPLPFSYLIEK